MEYIVTAEEMKYYDNYTIEKIGIPSLVLMERAALETFKEIESKMKSETKVLVCLGCGNNGGDALAIGRMAADKGAFVTFWMPGNLQKVSKETQMQIEILENLGFSILSNFPSEEYDIVIDGLFGIGLSRNIEGIYGQAIQKINDLRERGAYVVAVDIPSGVCADTGKILGSAVRANLTVTYAFRKAGHIFYPGKEHCGEVVVKQIGISDKGMKEKKPSYMAFKEDRLLEVLPKRKPNGNKGTFGKVLLFAGSLNMCGAAILCAKSILRTGAGMVKIITTQENREIIQGQLPEAMLYTYQQFAEEEEILKAVSWADVLVAGPGIGKSESSLQIMYTLLTQKQKPFVIDADGLNLIAENHKLQEMVQDYQKERIIMTPHPGELIRLAGETMEKYQKSPSDMVRETAKQYNCVVVGKDAVTLVAEPNKETIYINVTGNDGMATAGSGDVLAGVIGGLVAQKMNVFDAACLGTYIHGMAGNLAMEEKSKYGIIASDVSEKVCDVMNKYNA